MTAPTLPLRQLALGDLEHELNVTRRVLERVPDEHLAWKPHEKSMSLGGLATHIATIPSWIETILTQDEFDVATIGGPQQPLASRDEILARFDGLVAKVKELVSQAGDEELLVPWVLRRGETVILNAPRAAIVRTMGISHSIHHRAQLTVYLRQLGVPVPGIYGPSADEQ